MADDKIGIANLALRMVGGKRISSLNDGSTEADVISDCYDFIRDDLLEYHPWGHALLTVTLGQLTTIPLDPGVDGYTVAYALPTDFIKGYKISQPGARFKIQMMLDNGFNKKVMFADSASMQLQYLFRNDNPSTYSPKFKIALATKLAASICFALTQSVKKAAVLEALYDNKALPDACSSDSQQGTTEPIAQDDWQIARMSGGGLFGPMTPGAATWQTIWG